MISISIVFYSNIYMFRPEIEGRQDIYIYTVIKQKVKYLFYNTSYCFFVGFQEFLIIYNKNFTILIWSIVAR